MKNHTLTNKQYEIQRKQTASDKKCNNWLTENGLNEQQLATLPFTLLQAQRIATNILKDGARYLGQNQAHTLNNFLLAMSNTKKRCKLTEAHAYKVMNIGKEVNRKMFKAHKAIK